ncbi:oligopeptide/dipeptide ABC transporter ATP-binding protein [Rhizobium ruizarguesonis]
MVEEGRSEDVFARPNHPYTAALIAAIPDIDFAEINHDDAFA